MTVASALGESGRARRSSPGEVSGRMCWMRLFRICGCGVTTLVPFCEPIDVADRPAHEWGKSKRQRRNASALEPVLNESVLSAWWRPETHSGPARETTNRYARHDGSRLSRLFMLAWSFGWKGRYSICVSTQIDAAGQPVEFGAAT